MAWAWRCRIPAIRKLRFKMKRIFRLIEHSFLERFYHSGYEQVLVASLHRKHTAHTLYLMRRMCNDKTNPGRYTYTTLLQQLENKG